MERKVIVNARIVVGTLLLLGGCTATKSGSVDATSSSPPSPPGQSTSASLSPVPTSLARSTPFDPTAASATASESADTASSASATPVLAPAATFSDSDALVTALQNAGVDCQPGLTTYIGAGSEDAAAHCDAPDGNSYSAVVYASATDRDAVRADWPQYDAGYVNGDMWDVHCDTVALCNNLIKIFGGAAVHLTPNNELPATPTPTPTRLAPVTRIALTAMYGDAAEVLNALRQAGVRCTSGPPLPANGRSNMFCGDADEWLAIVWDSGTPAVERTVTGDLTDTSYVYGPNWALECFTTATCDQLRSIFGAAVKAGPQSPKAAADSSAAAAAKSSAALIAAGLIFPDGTYLVGKQVTPGTYAIEGDIQGCYWERTDKTGTAIDNNFINAAKRVQVTISATDYSFHSDNCGTWKPVS